MPPLRPGDRIRLVAMPQDPDPVLPGTTGTVTAIRPHRTWTQVDVDWDNGRKLMLSLPTDQYEIIPRADK
jgi:hypothetical protein